jgi:hypothetical protein
MGHQMKMFFGLLIACLLTIPAMAGERVYRKFTVPLKPGDEELLKQTPFLVDKDRDNYPKLVPQEMTTNELNQHLRLMDLKRKRRDGYKVNYFGIDTKGNPYKGK